MAQHSQLLVAVCVVVMLVTVTAAAKLQLHSMDTPHDADMPEDLGEYLKRIRRQDISNSEFEKASKKFRKQINQLRRLKCRPKPVKVSVSSFLKGDILDEYVRPEKVVVKRCLMNCSYCGDSGGIEKKVCLPTKTKMKQIFVLYNKDGYARFHKVKVSHDTKCQCREASVV